MFSQTAEYAMRAVVWLAGHRQNPEVATRIAEGTHVPTHYLAKVLHTLGRAGLVHAQRGLKGGYSLIREPADISVLDVVNAVDPVRRIERCPLGLEAHSTHLCALHFRLDAAIASVEKVLAETSIADIMADPRIVHPLGDPACGGRVPDA